MSKKISDPPNRARAIGHLLNLCGYRPDLVGQSAADHNCGLLVTAADCGGRWQSWPQRNKFLSDKYNKTILTAANEGICRIYRWLGGKSKTSSRWSAGLGVGKLIETSWICLDYDFAPTMGTPDEQLVESLADERIIDALGAAGLTLRWAFSGNRSTYQHLFLEQPIPMALAKRLAACMKLVFPTTLPHPTNPAIRMACISSVDSNLDGAIRLPLSHHASNGAVCRWAGTITVEQIIGETLTITPDPCNLDELTKACESLELLLGITPPAHQWPGEAPGNSLELVPLCNKCRVSPNVNEINATRRVSGPVDAGMENDFDGWLEGGIPPGAFTQALKGGGLAVGCAGL